MAIAKVSSLRHPRGSSSGVFSVFS